MRWSWLAASLLLACTERGGPSVGPDPTSTIAPTTKSTPTEVATTTPTSTSSSSGGTISAGFPPTRLDCTTDADCDYISLGSNCCDTCGSTVGTKAWVQDVLHYCAGQKGRKCPLLDCPYQPIDAKCIASKCTRVPKK
jgi:hypothetical protein